MVSHVLELLTRHLPPCLVAANGQLPLEGPEGVPPCDVNKS